MNYLGTVSILEDFLPIIQKILHIVNGTDFFTDFLERAADRIMRVKEQRGVFIQSLATKFEKAGIPLKLTKRKPVERKFYPVQNLSHRVDPAIFNAAIRKLDEATSMDVPEMVSI